MAEREGFEPSIQFPVYWFSKPAPSAPRPPFRNLCRFHLAEEEGFEPSEGVNPQRFSRPPPSTARPLLPNPSSSNLPQPPETCAPARRESPHIRHAEPGIKRHIAGLAVCRRAAAPPAAARPEAHRACALRVARRNPGVPLHPTPPGGRSSSISPP